MFDDMDDKFELEVITDSDGLFDTDNDNITDSEIKMSRRKTLYDVSTYSYFLYIIKTI